MATEKWRVENRSKHISNWVSKLSRDKTCPRP